MVFENRIIRGKGRYIPFETVTNPMLEFHSGTNAKWIFKTLGIRERHIAKNYEHVADMGYMAGLEAVKDANMLLYDIDAVIVSCSSASHFAPSIACQILSRLELSVPAFDINAVCSGFLYAIELACSLHYNNVLIIATEKYSSITDWSNRDCIYFGDGAGAIVLSKGDGRIITNLYADGKSGEAFIAKTGSYYTIKGKMVYDKAMEVLPTAIKKALKEAHIDNINTIDYIIPHQAGKNVIQALMESIDYPMERCVIIMDKYANLASASIPVAMNEVDGNNLLLVAIGSGWTWGTVIIQKL